MGSNRQDDRPPSGRISVQPEHPPQWFGLKAKVTSVPKVDPQLG